MKLPVIYRGLFLAIFLITGATSLLLVSACSEDDPITCPDYKIAVLQGYVTAAGQGISVEMGARAFDENNRSHDVFTATSDSTGWYHLELPTGLYRLEIEPSRNSFYGVSDLQDTVRVSTGTQRFDFPRGRVEIRLIMPQETEGHRYSLQLEGSPMLTPLSRDTVENGELTFVFPAHPPGAYTMRLSGQYQSRFYLPGSRDGSAADSLRVGTEALAQYEVDFSSSYASVEGSVTGSWVQAASGRMEINAISEDGYRVSYAYCDPDGSFRCGFLLPQTVYLASQHDHIRQFIGGDSASTAQRFELEPGDRITGVDVVESGLSVHLRGPGDLIQHRATVRLLDDSGTTVLYWTYGKSDLFLCNLPLGRYFIHVEGQCEGQFWSPQWYGGSEDYAQAQPIDLGESELREISFDLIEGGRIEGKVYEADGSPASHLGYILLDSDYRQMCSGFQATQDGRMLFRGLPNGTYYVASVEGAEGPWLYPGTRDILQATPIVITGHEAVTDIFWNLPADTKGGTP